MADSATIGRAGAIVRDSMQAKGPPGVSVAVGVDGRLVWAQGFGFADVARQQPVTPTTLFRIGSVSKSLAAVGLARLVQEGKIDLDSSVYRYAPDFPRKRWDFSVRQLAGHLAGVRHYDGNEFLLNRAFPTVRAGLAVFENDTLRFEPGTRFGYSTFGFNLLSYVMERASGRDFVTYMRENVLLPLGMRETFPDHADSSFARRTGFYSLVGGRWVVSPAVNSSYKWAGGGYVATPSDLVRFGVGLLEPRVLRPESVRELWTSQKSNDGKPTGYGIGFFTGVDGAGRRIVYHSGGSVGGTTHLLIYPDERVVVAMTGNGDALGWIGGGSVTGQIGELFIRARAEPRR